MRDRVAMVIDGGRTTVGIESTVLSLAGPGAVLLRPGMVTQADIETVIGPIRIARAVTGAAHPSPGMHRKHYSPSTPLVLVRDRNLPAGGRGADLWVSQAAEAT